MYRFDQGMELGRKNLQTFVVKKEEIKRLNISLPSGKAFKGNIKVQVILGVYHNIKLDAKVIIDESGRYYLSMKDKKIYSKASFVFTVDGYAAVEQGPFAKFEDIPDEFHITLAALDNSFRVTILDDETSLPLVGAIVEIIAGTKQFQTQPTDNLGQTIFSSLPEAFNLSVKGNGYAVYTSSFNARLQPKTEIRLIRGGELKGHFTVNQKAISTQAVLMPAGIKASLDKNGYFEFHHLPPGEYTIAIESTIPVEQQPTGLPVTTLAKDEIKSFSEKVKIVNKEILVIDLDSSK